VKRFDVRLGLELAPEGYAAIDVRSGEIHELSQVASRLPWRDSVLAPHEPRMPAHQYVVVQRTVLEDCRILEFIIDHHPETYGAYFRGYQHPTCYLEVDELRYWMSRLNEKLFVNRSRLDSCEPPRRVDQGARPIPREEWRAKPWFPQGSGYGEWKPGSGESSSSYRARRATRDSISDLGDRCSVPQRRHAAAHAAVQPPDRHAFGEGLLADDAIAIGQGEEAVVSQALEITPRRPLRDASLAREIADVAGQRASHSNTVTKLSVPAPIGAFDGRQGRQRSRPRSGRCRTQRRGA